MVWCVCGIVLRCCAVQLEEEMREWRVQWEELNHRLQLSSEENRSRGEELSAVRKRACELAEAQAERKAHVLCLQEEVATLRAALHAAKAEGQEASQRLSDTRRALEVPHTALHCTALHRTALH